VGPGLGPGRRAELGSFSVVPYIVRLAALIWSAEQPGFARPDRV
jgi:hypothetical protein